MAITSDIVAGPFAIAPYLLSSLILHGSESPKVLTKPSLISILSLSFYGLNKSFRRFSSVSLRFGSHAFLCCDLGLQQLTLLNVIFRLLS